LDIFELLKSTKITVLNFFHFFLLENDRKLVVLRIEKTESQNIDYVRQKVRFREFSRKNSRIANIAEMVDFTTFLFADSKSVLKNDSESIFKHVGNFYFFILLHSVIRQFEYFNLTCFLSNYYSHVDATSYKSKVI
jgi:hypothetical protein